MDRWQTFDQGFLATEHTCQATLFHRYSLDMYALQRWARPTLLNAVILRNSKIKSSNYGVMRFYLQAGNLGFTHSIQPTTSSIAVFFLNELTGESICYGQVVTAKLGTHQRWFFLTPQKVDAAAGSANRPPTAHNRCVETQPSGPCLNIPRQVLASAERFVLTPTFFDFLFKYTFFQDRTGKPRRPRALCPKRLFVSCVPQLAGEIPANLSNLNALEELDLSQNKLTGALVAPEWHRVHVARGNRPKRQIPGQHRKIYEAPIPRGPSAMHPQSPAFTIVYSGSAANKTTRLQNSRNVPCSAVLSCGL